MIIVTHKNTQGAEKLHAQTSWGDTGTKTKIYCQAIMSDVRPCNATDRQSGYD